MVKRVSAPGPDAYPTPGPRARSESGFTLIELIVVLAVMALLMTALIPPVLEYRVTVNERERAANESAINDAIRQCYALEGRYPPVAGETGLDYLRENYQIVLKTHLYDYSYDIIYGNPVLSVEMRGSK